MTALLEVLAVIPARGGSKGLPFKNIKRLNGIPMISYTIEAALKSISISELVVSTDHEDIAKISIEAGAKVPFLRPQELASDTATSIDVLKHMVNYYESSYHCKINHVMLLQPTSPLRNAEDIDNAYKIYKQNNADSLQSVTYAETHPYLLRKIEDAKLVPYSFLSDKENVRRQDMDELYTLNGAIYIARRDILMNDNTLVGKNNVAYIMPKERSIDIDDIYDFKYAELLIKEQELQ